ncbi:MAG TPA: hypothetical protein VHD60_00325 [Candidatus Saccharimonadales bacterium]|nr:hypothetical protein [Candidatus Saccharimonadales bacterium]
MAHELSLPTLVVGPADLVHIRREVEALDEYVRAASLREGGKPTAALPRLSRSLEALAQQNKLNLLQETDRETLKSFLGDMLKHAPVVHVSFAVDPSAAFTTKIVMWFRENIDPGVLIQIGLQPTIAAGCVVRTPNHYYDFSLRQYFAKHKHLLIEKLESTT